MPQPIDEYTENISAAQHNRMLGIPIPKGTRGRFLKRIVYRLCRPFLYRQLLFNDAIVQAVEALAHQSEQSHISDRNRINQVALEATSIIERVNSGLRQIDLELASQMARLQSDSSDLTIQVQELHAELEGHISAQTSTLAQYEERLSHVSKGSTSMSESVHEALSKFETSSHELHYLQAQTRTLLGILQKKTSQFTPAIAEDESSTPVDLLSGSDTWQDSYLALQDSFRGPSAEIRERLAVYLDDLVNASRSGFPVLDLGCGRGDLLQLLKDSEVQAYGIDQNELSVEHGHSQGLDIRLDDIFNHLSTVKPSSISAITAIHVVEHFDGATIVRFLGLCSRALIPGGLIILETPNPENVLVGSCKFYFDPTHVAPLPPQLLEFMVHSVGFDEIETRRFRRDTWWQPVPIEEMQHLPAAFSSLFDMIQQSFLAPEDYAIVARNALV